MKNFFDGLFERYFSYFKGVFVNKLKNLELAIKILLGLFLFQSLIILILINYTIKASIYKDVNFCVNKNTLQEGSEYQVKKDSASRSLFENIGYGIIHELTSFTYMTIQNKTNFALSMVHPDNYDEIYVQLNKDTKFAIENRVEQKFEIKDWKYKQINSSTAKITAIGILNRKVGGISIVDNEKYEASVTINIVNYAPFIVGLDLNYDDKKRKDRETRQEIIDNLDQRDFKGMKDEKIKK
ncbi:hypothetical protein ACOTVS_11120 [Aliarcobacter butzleri]